MYVKELWSARKCNDLHQISLRKNKSAFCRQKYRQNTDAKCACFFDWNSVCNNVGTKLSPCSNANVAINSTQLLASDELSK